MCNALEARKDTGSLGARVTGKLLNVGAVTWTLVLCKSSMCSLAPGQVSLKVFLYISTNWASLSWRHYYQSSLWILQLCSLVPVTLPKVSVDKFSYAHSPLTAFMKVSVTWGEAGPEILSFVALSALARVGFLASSFFLGYMNPWSCSQWSKLKGGESNRVKYTFLYTSHFNLDIWNLEIVST